MFFSQEWFKYLFSSQSLSSLLAYEYMESALIASILYGILGGLVRALVGIAKHFEENKREGKIRFWPLLFTLMVAALVGGLAGGIADQDWRVAVIAGYAGTDFLEGLYKIKKRQGIEI